MNGQNEKAGAEGARDAWRWFVILGASLALFGALALASLAFQTMASANLVGMLMIVGGFVLILHAMNTRQLGWFYFWLGSGILYALAGGAVVYDPRFAISTLTLFLAADFILISFLRLWIAMGSRGSLDRAWLFVTCMVTVGLGALFALRPAISALWVLILALAIDLVLQGAAFAAMGVSLDRHRRHGHHARARGE
jgi:uncharacterized membrane protein HdeD (DUF308 family)